MYGGSRGDVGPMTEADAEREIEGLMKRDYVWVIDAGSFIGHVRLDRVDLNDRRASIAIGIADASRLGQGLGSQAIALVQGYAFNSLRLHRLSLRVVAYNRRAIRAYEKCGFVIEGREREAALVDGEWHDDVIMGILDREHASMLLQR